MKLVTRIIDAVEGDQFTFQSVLVGRCCGGGGVVHPGSG